MGYIEKNLIDDEAVIYEAKITWGALNNFYNDVEEQKKLETDGEYERKE